MPSQTKRVLNDLMDQARKLMESKSIDRRAAMGSRNRIYPTHQKQVYVRTQRNSYNLDVNDGRMMGELVRMEKLGCATGWRFT